VKKNSNLTVLRFIRWTLIAVLSIGMYTTAHAAGGKASYPPDPSLLASLKIAAPLDFCGERVPLENPEVRERLEKELLLTLWDRPQVILWLKRSRRYLSYIEEQLQNNGMPGDLKYIALAESALRPHASSQKGALGFWQFMEQTGKQYGLAINKSIDERRNVFTSTQAAISYFNDLYKKFGSWTLVAAGFNMGGGGLAADIEEQGTKDYYNLYLPLETQRYIFRVISAKLILSDPKRYGFDLSDEDYYPPLEFDRIEISCSQETHLRIIAQAAKTYFKVIKDLNPEIRGYFLTEGKHTLLIPKGTAPGFESRYRSLLNHHPTDEKEIGYVVKERDTLSAIAEQFGIPVTVIIARNHLDPRGSIRPGHKLIIPREPERVQSDGSEGKGASPVND
jgi:membrane-bound lytic murein transglycosylase D